MCGTLDGLQGSIVAFSRGQSEHLLTVGYPICYEELEAARGGLERLGLYEEIQSVLVRSEAMVREGKYHDAEMLVLDANRNLSEASGANADLRRLYMPQKK